MNKIAYDIDGSRMFLTGLAEPSGADREADSSFMSAVNSETDGGGLVQIPVHTYLAYETYAPNYENHFIAVQLTQPHELQAVFAGYSLYSSSTTSSSAAVGALGGIEVQTSTNSTNGVDGTWITVANFTYENPIYEAAFNTANPSEAASYFANVRLSGEETLGGSTNSFFMLRDHYSLVGFGAPLGPQLVAGIGTRNVTWVRIRPVGRSSIRAMYDQLWAKYKLHLFGVPDTLASTQRLEIVDVSGNNPVELGLGNLSKLTTRTKTFKLKNLHPALTASGVKLSVIPGSRPRAYSPDGYLHLSLDQVTWGQVLDVSSIGPESLSDTLYLRAYVDDDLIGPYEPRLFVSVEEWV